MKKRSKKHIDIDDMKAGTELDELVAKNVYVSHCATWFIKDGRKILYYGPRFSENLAEAMSAIKFYIVHHKVISYKLDEQLEKNPFACTAEMRIPGKFYDLSYIRSWAPALPLAIARMLAKVPKK